MATIVYQIRLKGHLGAEWADWFGGLTITLEENNETLLTGPVLDQAALHGLLKKVRDLGIPLIYVPFEFVIGVWILVKGITIQEELK
jgi:hypothetical protein